MNVIEAVGHNVRSSRLVIRPNIATRLEYPKDHEIAAVGSLHETIGVGDSSRHRDAVGEFSQVVAADPARCGRGHVRLRPGMLAVITGAGSGIGLAVARALADRGCRLALIEVREDRESARAAAAGAVVSAHPADVRDDEAVRRAAAEIRRAHGPVALLVNSAGVSLAGPFADTDADAFDWVMEVNFGGTVRCRRVFLPQLRERGSGRIVNIGSCFGWVGFPAKSGYCASKFAVRGFSESLRSELRPGGIGVTVAYPGPVNSNLVRDGRATDERTRSQKVAFLARRSLPADQAARGIERNAARVLVGLDYRLIDLLVRMAPSSALGLIGRFGRRFPGGGPAEPGAAPDPTRPASSLPGVRSSPSGPSR